MSDLAEAGEAAHGLDDVVRRLSARLIDHEDSIERRRLWDSRHFGLGRSAGFEPARFGAAARYDFSG
jgi:hypothetical protein